jgi:lactoylglutathione lyase
VYAVSAITLFVEDLDAAKSFYRTVFELPAHYEDADSAVFAFGPTLVNLLAASAAPEVIAPATVAPPAGGRRGLLTVTVEDVDAACSRLATHGVALLNGPVDRPWGVRTAAFQDPAGHIWELAQPIG